MKTIILNSKQESELNQILNELIYSLNKTWKDDDLVNLATKIFKESLKETYKSKKNTAKKTLKIIEKHSMNALAYASIKFDEYKHNGIKNGLSNDLKKIKEIAINSPEKIKYLSKSIKHKISEVNANFFNKTKEEKIEIISVTLIGILIFYASAGGTDLEGGIPDSDLNAGIGHHRNIFSHTILMGFLVEFMMRSGLGMIENSYKNLPEVHHKFWDKSNDLIKKHKEFTIGAMWAGIGAHLLKDANLFNGRTKPYTGLPFEMSMKAHQGLFAANGAAAFVFAYNNIKKEASM